MDPVWDFFERAAGTLATIGITAGVCLLAMTEYFRRTFHTKEAAADLKKSIDDAAEKERERLEREASALTHRVERLEQTMSTMRDVISNAIHDSIADLRAGIREDLTEMSNKIGIAERMALAAQDSAAQAHGRVEKNTTRIDNLDKFGTEPTRKVIESLGEIKLQINTLASEVRNLTQKTGGN